MYHNEDFVTLSQKNKKSLEHILIKLGEEVGELNEAFLNEISSNGNEYKTKEKCKKELRDDVLEEAVDVLMIVYSFLIKKGFKEEEIDKTLKTKVEKWKKVSN